MLQNKAQPHQQRAASADINCSGSRDARAGASTSRLGVRVHAPNDGGTVWPVVWHAACRPCSVCDATGSGLGDVTDFSICGRRRCLLTPSKKNAKKNATLEKLNNFKFNQIYI